MPFDFWTIPCRITSSCCGVTTGGVVHLVGDVLETDRLRRQIRIGGIAAGDGAAFQGHVTCSPI